MSFSVIQQKALSLGIVTALSDSLPNDNGLLRCEPGQIAIRLPFDWFQPFDFCPHLVYPTFVFLKRRMLALTRTFVLSFRFLSYLGILAALGIFLSCRRSGLGNNLVQSFGFLFLLGDRAGIRHIQLSIEQPTA